MTISLESIHICAVTAHADKGKIGVLAKTIRSLASLPVRVDFFILTILNTEEYGCALKSKVGAIPANCRYQLINEGFEKLESPWLLTWAHKNLMSSKFQTGIYSHYLYLEDDMRFSTENLLYWLRDRRLFINTPFFPSFLRIEWSTANGHWMLVDFVEGDRFPLQSLPRIDSGDGRVFVSLPRPYQGMFFYDTELMAEHLQDERYLLEQALPDWKLRILHNDWPLGLTEAANTGISLTSVPTGFFSRNLTPVYAYTMQIDPACLVHHMPDKYTNASGVIGKISVHMLLSSN